MTGVMQDHTVNIVKYASHITGATLFSSWPCVRWHGHKAEL